MKSRQDKQLTGPTLYLVSPDCFFKGNEKPGGQQGVGLYPVGLREQCSFKKMMKRPTERTSQCGSLQGQQAQLI